MKKNKGSSLGRKSLIAVLATLGLFSTAQGSQYTPNNQSYNVRANKEAINKVPEAPRPMSRKIFSGSDNPYKQCKLVHNGQKKYRKHLRSNPHLRNSKKNRLNN